MNDFAQPAYMWAYAIIDSIQHQFHFDAAEKIVELYQQKFPAETEKHLALQSFLAIKKNDVQHTYAPALFS